jgi:probable rRNA maturation factor
VIRIVIANLQTRLKLDRRRLREAVRTALAGEGVERASISLAVVDDRRMAELHERYLGEPTPTDVLSFLIDDSDGCLEGEIVLSAETAQVAAPRFGWAPEDELLLYAVHGALHLAGCDDATPAERARMRRLERACLARLGLEGRYRPVVRPGRRPSKPGRTS